MSNYKSISTADLKAIFDFTKEDIKLKKELEVQSPELKTQIKELEEVNQLIYDELLGRALNINLIR